MEKEQKKKHDVIDKEKIFIGKKKHISRQGPCFFFLCTVVNQEHFSHTGKTNPPTYNSIPSNNDTNTITIAKQ